MTAQTYSATEDVTGKQPKVGGGMVHELQWMCGHRHTHGQYRAVPGLRRIAWRCASCMRTRIGGA